MQPFPLIRTKWSNERLMALLLLVLLLYNLPRWLAMPSDIWTAFLLLVFGLVVDTAANFVRYRRPICAVSAAITVVLLHTLSPGAPLWVKILAAAAALLFGKHVWGGTGKNPLNPAMLGLLVLTFFSPIGMPVFEPSLLLLPAVLLSLPFLLFRPYAAIGMMSGMAAALFMNQELTFMNVLAYGVVLWGSLVITDPVTTTAKPVAGAMIGVLAGFVPLIAGGSAAALALAVLAANGLSLLADRFSRLDGSPMRLSFGKRQRIAYSRDKTAYHDLVDATPPVGEDASQSDFSSEEILRRIACSQVFGLGGAAFPTAQKIRTVREAGSSPKHLIVNGAECDPGLIHDKWLLDHHSDGILQGINFLRQCVSFTTVTIAAKDIAGLACQPPVRLHRVPDYYPAGAERLLICEVLGRKLAEGVVPADEGILVLNVQTVYAVNEAVRGQRPFDSRLITVANLESLTGSIVRVRLGMKVQDVLDKVLPGNANSFIGGGMMNARMASADSVVDESVNFIAIGKFPKFKESPLCSRCGFCSAVCPARLPVQEIARLVDEDKLDLTVPLHPERCMACGSCSQVCLAGRNLAARISVAKRTKPE